MELVKTVSNSKLTKSLLLIILGSILLTISAKIQIPFYPVPMTMQTFVVIFIGIAFGWKLGLATVAAYLVEGAIGLPVFAGTPEKGIGIAYMISTTGGYLFGFLVAVFIAGFIFHDVYQQVTVIQSGILAPGFIAGSILGQYLFKLVPTQWFSKATSIMLLVIGLVIIVA